MRLAALWVVCGCAQTLPVPSVAPIQEPALAYGGLITEVATAQGVDWEALRERRDVLERYLGWVAQHGPLTDDIKESREVQRLAMSLNAHNAWVLYAVLQRGAPERLDQLSLPWGRDLFSGTRVRIDSEWLTLELMQQERLLARFQDPTVHAGIYRANRTSPALRLWAPTGLWGQLEDATRAWLASERGLRGTADGYAINARIVAYADDFTEWGDAETLCDWLAPYAPADAARWLEAHREDCVQHTFPEDLALDRAPPAAPPAAP